ncbi:hypothetical protein [Pelovirga terrestris]|uniref:Uncharacterized protein n=1 Tax=Pelovirga terrestris TaxID=2771352 RepID=A0A8J6UQA0_9BACT|nr:hypothetical protein [Pelovirga terrestris]MBD1401864.1 hypothetical protein [Pelovirga terrestris]
MSTEKDVIQVALEVGQRVMMNAQGDPARTLAYGVAAAVAAVGAGIGYGSYKYGRKALDWLSD